MSLVIGIFKSRKKQKTTDQIIEHEEETAISTHPTGIAAGRRVK